MKILPLEKIQKIKLKVNQKSQDLKILLQLFRICSVNKTRV